MPWPAVSFISFESMNAEAIFVGIKGIVRQPSSVALLKMRTAISLLLAARSFFIAVISDGWELKLGYQKESRHSRRYFAESSIANRLLDLG